MLVHVCTHVCVHAHAWTCAHSNVCSLWRLVVWFSPLFSTLYFETGSLIELNLMLISLAGLAGQCPAPQHRLNMYGFYVWIEGPNSGPQACGVSVSPGFELASQEWPWIPDPPSSTFGMPGLRACALAPGLIQVSGGKNKLVINEMQMNYYACRCTWLTLMSISWRPTMYEELKSISTHSL